MSRQARARSSLAAVLVLLVAAVVWIAGRELARGSDTSVTTGTTGTVATTSTTSTSNAHPAAVYPTPTDFKVKLLRAGLSPRALTAAGVSSQSILATLQAAADVMNGAPSALSSADSDFASARVAAEARERKIRSGTASSEDVSGYAALQTALANATSARQAILDGYFNAAIAGLNETQRTRLTATRTNSTWEIPVEYLVSTRTEAQMVALRDALSNERSAAGLSESPSEAASTLLTSVRAEGAVSAAISGVESNLAAVTTAWNTAAGD